MTIIQYRDNIYNTANHSVDPNTKKIQKVWVEAWPNRYACLRNSETVTLRHERINKDIKTILQERDWTPLSNIDGYEKVMEIINN
mgnify:CR=1 FL=1